MLTEVIENIVKIDEARYKGRGREFDNTEEQAGKMKLENLHQSHTLRSVHGLHSGDAVLHTRSLISREKIKNISLLFTRHALVDFESHVKDSKRSQAYL